jgi:hypothetical protein
MQGMHSCAAHALQHCSSLILLLLLLLLLLFTPATNYHFESKKQNERFQGKRHHRHSAQITIHACMQVEHAAPAIQEDILTQMLHGAAAQLREEGCELAGGHSAEGAENGLGFCITGHALPGALMYKDQLKSGQLLVLTKPIGTGIILRGAMLGETHGELQIAAWRSMLQSSARASESLKHCGIAACTDVTGFGLLGHAWEMASASHVRHQRCALPAAGSGCSMCYSTACMTACRSECAQENAESIIM